MGCCHLELLTVFGTFVPVGDFSLGDVPSHHLWYPGDPKRFIPKPLIPHQQVVHIKKEVLMCAEAWMDI